MVYMTSATDGWETRHLKLLPFLITLTAWAMALAINGAVPFVTLPTLGQAVWTMGFAQSMATQAPWALHAVHFGAPEPAAIAFGLAGAYPASLLLRLGVHTADAYTLMACGWLTVAFFGAREMARILGVDAVRASLAALCWLGLPMVWMHSGYSMLSFGMALLPAYYTTVWRLASNKTTRAVVTYFAACLIAVFMDGYTYIMFAVAALTTLVVLGAMAQGHARRTIARTSTPLAIGGLTVAYLLFATYIGKYQFDAAPLDVFRAFGVDLAYIVLPTSGVLWLPDLIGAATDRRAALLFGDHSVWTTTFILPILIAATAALVTGWKTQRHAIVFALLAFGGLYMSLGPSLKISAAVDRSAAARANHTLMPVDQAMAPTGSAFLDEHVPGLKNMRATYRWLALGLLGMWLLMAMAMANRPGPWTLACFAVIALNLPHLGRLWRDGELYRRALTAIDRDADSNLGHALVPGETVSFLPFNNDFLVNYVAARLRIRALNVGGDKNLAYARAHWPFRMKQFEQGAIDAFFVDRVVAQLASGEVQAVVIPYVDMLWAAHFWPCPAEMAEQGSTYLRMHAAEAPGECPDQIRRSMAPTIEQLRVDKSIDVEQTPSYAIVRLARQGRQPPEAFLMAARKAVEYPATLNQGSRAATWLLGPGWYTAEMDHVWSGPFATLNVPLPADCAPDSCQFVLSLQPFGATPRHPITVRFSDGTRKLPLTCFVAESAERREVALSVGQPLGKIDIEVDGALTPQAVGVGNDMRPLGIALYSIAVSRNTSPITARAACPGGA